MWGFCADGRIRTVTKPDMIKTKGVKSSPSILSLPKDDGEVAVGTTDGGASDGYFAKAMLGVTHPILFTQRRRERAVAAPSPLA
jgi:hypothetical protein